jgi:hypothetical protein
MSDLSPSSPSTPQSQAMQGPLRGDGERIPDSTGAALPEQQEVAVEATTPIDHVVPDLVPDVFPDVLSMMLTV